MKDLWAVQFILVDDLGSNYDRYGDYMQVTFDCMDYENFTVAKCVRLLTQHCYNYGGVTLGKDIFIQECNIILHTVGIWQPCDMQLIRKDLTRL
jgi:hypothetical protein